MRSHRRHDATRLRCWQICSDSSRLSQCRQLVANFLHIADATVESRRRRRCVLGLTRPSPTTPPNRATFSSMRSLHPSGKELAALFRRDGDAQWCNFNTLGQKEIDVSGHQRSGYSRQEPSELSSITIEQTAPASRRHCGSQQDRKASK